MNSVVTRDGVDREEMEIERLGGKGTSIRMVPLPRSAATTSLPVPVQTS